MDADDRDRLVYLGALDTLNRNRWRAFYDDLPYYKAVLAALISDAIFFAQKKGKPFTIQGLSAHLGIPRPTLYRKLDYLGRKGFVVRRVTRHVDGHTEVFLELDGSILQQPARLANLRRQRNVFRKAAKSFSRCRRHRR